MATTVKTIRKDGLGDYTTLQSWEDAAPANLVTDGNIWQGQIALPGDVFSESLLISGSTSDATHYKELTTATGASFRDHANAQTNPLAYDSTKGCAITAATDAVVELRESSARISNIQIRNTATTYTRYALFLSQANITAKNLIVEASSGTLVYPLRTQDSTGVKIINSIFIQRTSGSARIAYIQNTNTATNCTFVAPIGLATPPTTAIHGNYGAALLKNCAIFGATNLSSGTTPTFTTCVSDKSGTGITQITYNNSAFADTTANWKPVAGSRLLNVGTTDATNAATDIVGTGRPQGSAYDVGCWEYVRPPQRVMRLFAGFKIQFKSGVLRIR